MSMLAYNIVYEGVYSNHITIKEGTACFARIYLCTHVTTKRCLRGIEAIPGLEREKFVDFGLQGLLVLDARVLHAPDFSSYALNLAFQLRLHVCDKRILRQDALFRKEKVQVHGQFQV